MEKPTLREAIEYWREKRFLPMRMADVVCEAILGFKGTLEWFEHCERVHDEHHKRTNDMMAFGLKCGYQQCKENLQRKLASLLVEKPPKPAFPQGPYWPVVPRGNIHG